MIPIRDHNPSGKFPFFTYLLIAVNTVIFFYMLSLPMSAFETFINTYALVPARFLAGKQTIALFSSMFLHGGFGHLFGNMLFLHIFGDNLEDRLGHLGYLIFYLFTGIGASALQIAINPGSNIPQLGASGAIAGIMGGYLALFPRRKIDILFGIGLFFRRATVPAYFMLFYWIAFQFLFGVGSLAAMDPTMGGVAYFAHVGGFVTGWLVVNLLPIAKER
jgi:membrane associated rhomboid family serine protease